jgi:hypothetical protein
MIDHKKSKLENLQECIINNAGKVIIPTDFNMNYIKTNTCFPISINSDLNGNIFPHIFEKPKNNQNTISACQINVKFNDTQSKNIANSWFNTSIKMSNTANKYIRIKHKELKNLFLRINDLKYQIKRHITEKYKLGQSKQLLEKIQINKIKNREIREYNKILQNKIMMIRLNYCMIQKNIC